MEILEWISLGTNIGQVVCSGLDLDVLNRPMGEAKLVPEDGIRVNETLTATLKENWHVDGWEWQRYDGSGWVKVGDSGNQYTLTGDDEGKLIRVIASIAHGKTVSDPVSVEAPSDPVAMGAPVEAALDLVGGAVDAELRASIVAARVESPRFEWKRLPKGSDAKVAGNWELRDFFNEDESVSIYTPGWDDAGATVRVTATYTVTGADHAPVEKALSRDCLIGEVVIDPAICTDGAGKAVCTTASIGDKLHARRGTGGRGLGFSYSWHLKDAPGPALGGGSSYFVTPRCAGKEIFTRVHYKDLKGRPDPAQPKESSTVRISTPALTVSPAAPRLGAKLTAEVQNATVKDAASGSGFSVQYQWYNMSDPSVPLQGEESKSYTPQEAGSYRAQITWYDNQNQMLLTDQTCTSQVIKVVRP